MQLNLMESFSNWNPQLIREMKGRLKPRNITLVVGVSIVSQALLMLFFYAQLPTEKSPYGKYILTSKQLPVVIEWQTWWNDIFIAINWILPLALILGGVYMLIQDLAMEEKRGTLNFIRLSPQPGWSILAGKVLGVPILLYLGLALVFPLSILVAIQAEIPLGLVLLQNSVFGIIAVSFFSVFLLFPLVGFATGWLGTLMALFIAMPSLGFLNSIFSVARLANSNPEAWQNFNNQWNLWIKWFNIPVSYSMASWYFFMSTSLIILMIGTWQVLNRHFSNPATTLLSKKQSYIAVFSFNLFLLGFVCPIRDNFFQGAGEFFIYFIIPFCLLITIAALSPQRQALQDWARYRRESTHSKKIKNRQLLQDLLWSEKSPSLLAILVNVMITVVMWTPWILSYKFSFGSSWKILYSLFLVGSLILICGIISQLALLKKVRKPAFWATGSVLTILGFPLLIVGVLQIHPSQHPLPFLLSFIPVVGVESATLIDFVIATVIQGVVLVLTTLQLQKKLIKAGESQSKALLTNK